MIKYKNYLVLVIKKSGEILTCKFPWVDLSLNLIILNSSMKDNNSWRATFAF